MGFLGSLFGWDQTMGAVNAVLASHLIDYAKPEERKRIAAEVIRIVSSVQGRLTSDSILENLSRESRVVQTNFIALACDNLGIDPPVRNNVWTRVENPYRIGSQVDASRIALAVKTVAEQDGVRVNWPGNEVRINFVGMYSDGITGGSGASKPPEFKVTKIARLERRGYRFEGDWAVAPDGSRTRIVTGFDLDDLLDKSQE